MIYRITALIVVFLVVAVSPSEARHRHHIARIATETSADSFSDRVIGGRPFSGETIISGRRSGFPHAFCGAEASYYVFGVTRRELWLASNWIRLFPRTLPSPGMAAARSGHVMILMTHVGGSEWLVHDGNSGGHLTREHVRSINGYVIVNPHSRIASR
jgi:hypothetical protein